jgi:hypothetical protein
VPTRLFLRNTQTEPGTGDAVYDLSEDQGSNNVTIGIEANNFDEVARWQMEISEELDSASIGYSIRLDQGGSSEGRLVAQYRRGGSVIANSPPSTVYTESGTHTGTLVLDSLPGFESGDIIAIMAEANHSGGGGRLLEAHVNDESSFIDAEFVSAAEPIDDEVIEGSQSEVANGHDIDFEQDGESSFSVILIEETTDTFDEIDEDISEGTESIVDSQVSRAVDDTVSEQTDLTIEFDLGTDLTPESPVDTVSLVELGFDIDFESDGDVSTSTVVVSEEVVDAEDIEETVSEGTVSDIDAGIVVTVTDDFEHTSNSVITSAILIEQLEILEGTQSNINTERLLERFEGIQEVSLIQAEIDGTVVSEEDITAVTQNSVFTDEIVTSQEADEIHEATNSVIQTQNVADLSVTVGEGTHTDAEVDESRSLSDTIEVQTQGSTELGVDSIAGEINEELTGSQESAESQIDSDEIVADNTQTIVSVDESVSSQDTDETHDQTESTIQTTSSVEVEETVTEGSESLTLTDTSAQVDRLVLTNTQSDIILLSPVDMLEVLAYESLSALVLDSEGLVNESLNLNTIVDLFIQEQVSAQDFEEVLEGTVNVLSLDSELEGYEAVEEASDLSDQSSGAVGEEFDEQVLEGSVSDLDAGISVTFILDEEVTQSEIIVQSDVTSASDILETVEEGSGSVLDAGISITFETDDEDTLSSIETTDDADVAEIIEELIQNVTASNILTLDELIAPFEPEDELVFEGTVCSIHLAESVFTPGPWRVCPPGQGPDWKFCKDPEPTTWEPN